MSKNPTKEALMWTNPAARDDGQASEDKTATIATLNKIEDSMFKSTSNSDPCERHTTVRSRIEELEFQKARGWLDSKMAAAYLGISVKTFYNLRNKGLLKSDSDKKLIFRLNKLDEFLKGTKNAKH